SWNQWFSYLLPFCIMRATDQAYYFLLESLITAFIRRHPDSLSGEYPGFPSDAIHTVGLALMKPEFWDDEGECSAAYRQGWIRSDGQPIYHVLCSGAISASLFFCLKYLDLTHIKRWVESIIRIRSSYFRAHFMVWLASFHEITSGTSSFSFAALESASNSIDWRASHLLESTNPKISDASIKQFFETLTENMDTQVILSWVSEASKYRELDELLNGYRIPDYISDEILAG